MLALPCFTVPASGDNEFLEWLKAAGPLLIAGLVAYVTWRFQQWQAALEKEKLRHQLYDRRFVIYKAFEKLLKTLVKKPDDPANKPHDEIKAAFQEATVAGSEALFLLPDPDVQAYLKELQTQVFDDVIRNIIFFEEGISRHPELMNVPQHVEEHAQRSLRFDEAKRAIYQRLPELSQQFRKFMELTDFNEINHKKKRHKLFHKRSNLKTR